MGQNTLARMDSAETEQLVVLCIPEEGGFCFTSVLLPTKIDFMISHISGRARVCPQKRVPENLHPPAHYLLWRNPKENFWPGIDRLQKGTGAEWDQAITPSVTTMMPSAPWSRRVGWTPCMICVPQGAGNLYSRAVKQTSPNRSSAGISADDRQAGEPWMAAQDS